jgi:hypothetical protein
MNTGAWPSRFGGDLNLGQKNMVMSPAGLGPENDCSGKNQQELLTTDPSSRKRRCIRTMTARVQLNKINWS